MISFADPALVADRTMLDYKLHRSIGAPAL